MKSLMKKIRICILAVICMIPAFMLAGCTDDVPVTAINFREERIEMLVGDSYEPQVFCSPNSASNKRYGLKSNDTTIVTASGTSLTARSKGTAIVTAVSSSESKTASIVVIVYDKSVQLGVPSDIKYDGEALTFSASENAYNFDMRLNGQIIHLGNTNTYRNFDAGRVNTVEIMAVGNGRATISSAFSEEYKFFQIAQPTNLRVENGVLTFDAVENVSKYKITLKTDNNEDTEQIVDTNSLNLSNLIESGKEYNISVKALKDGYTNENLDENVEIFASRESASIVVSKSNAPTNLRIDKNKLIFDNAVRQSTFELEIYSGSNQVLTTQFNDDFYDLSALDAGEYSIKVRQKTTGTNALFSDWSTPLVATKLVSPAVTIADGVVKISAVTDAVGYNVVVNGAVIDIRDASEFVLGSSFGVGEYTIGAQAYGDAQTIISNVSTTISATKLATPRNLALNNYVLSFDDVNDSASFKLTVSADLASEVKVNDIIDVEGNSYTFAPSYFAETTKTDTYRLQLQAYKAGNYLLSEKTEIYLVYKLATPQNVNLTDEKITIENEKINIVAVESTIGYKIEFYLADTNVLVDEKAFTPPQTYSDLPALDAGKYSVKIMATGNNANVLDSGIVQLDDIDVLAVPTIRAESNAIIWNAVEKATGYFITRDEVLDDKLITDLSYNIDLLEAGVYNFKIRAYGDGQKIISSKYSEIPLVITKLSQPTDLDYQNGKLTWSAVEGATAYDVCYKNEETDNIDSFRVGTNSYDIDFASKLAGSYNYYVIALGNSNTVFDSKPSQDITIVKQAKATDLRLEGNTVKWNYDIDSTYELVVNGIVIDDLANGSFDLIKDYLPIANFETAQEYTITLITKGESCKLVADGVVVKVDSDPTDSLVITKLAQTTDVSLSSGVLKWKINTSAVSYSLVVDGNVLIENVATNENNDAGYQTYDLNASLTAGEHTVAIIANGNGVNSFDSNASNYLASEIRLTKLPAVELKFNPSVYNASDNTYTMPFISWNAITGADHYALYIRFADGNDELTDSLGSITGTSYSLENIDKAGDVTFMVRAYGNSNDILYSDFAEMNIERLNAPKLIVANGKLSWEGVLNANSYLLFVQNPATSVYELVDEYAGIASYDFADRTAGAYDVRLIARNSLAQTEIKYADSVMAEMTVIKLNPPINFTVYDGKFKFDMVTGAEGYEITIGKYKHKIGADQTSDLELHSMLAERVEDAKLVATADGKITSSPTTIKVRMLSSPLGVKMVGGNIVWDKIQLPEGSSDAEYVVTIQKGTDVEKFDAGVNTSLAFPDLNWGTGEYYIYIQAKSGVYLDNGELVYQTISPYSTTYTVIIQDSVSIIQSVDGLLSWGSISTAVGYNVKIVDASGHENVVYVTDASFDMSDYVGFRTVSVMTKGNGENILDSDYSMPVHVITMPKVETIGLVDGKVTFDAVSIFNRAKLTFTSVDNSLLFYEFDCSPSLFDGANNAKTWANIVETFGTDYTNWNYTNVFNTINNSYILNKQINIPKGSYKLTIKLIGNTHAGSVDLAKGNIIVASSQTSVAVEMEKLGTPIVNVDDGIISWTSSASYAELKTFNVYVQRVYKENNESKTEIHTFQTNVDWSYNNISSIDFKQNSFAYTDLNGQSRTITFGEAGEYKVYVSLQGDSTKYLTSNDSNIESVRILEDPEIKQIAGEMTWETIPYATEYRIDYTINESSKSLYVMGDRINFVTDFTDTKGITHTFPAGEYDLRIFAVGNGKDILNSKSGKRYTKRKLDITDAQFTLTEGLLEWNIVSNMAYYYVDIDNAYTSQYGGIIVNANEPNESLKFDNINNVLTYEIPTNLVVGIHSVRIYAIGDNESLLSSSFSKVITAEKLVALSTPSLNGGRLEWLPNGNNRSGFDVKVSFIDDEGNTISFIKNINESTFILPDSVTLSNGIVYQLNGRDYTVWVKVRGTSYRETGENYFNSDYSNELGFARYDDITNVHTTKGELTWTEVNNADNYYITIGGLEVYTDSTLLAQDNLSSLAGGQYLATICAMGNRQYMTSRITTTSYLTKFDSPTGLKTDGTKIVWDAVENATGYRVELGKLNDAGEYEIQPIETTTDNNFTLPSSYDGLTFKVRVMAISLEDNDNYLNSEWCEECIVNKAEPISNLRFDDVNKQWVWTAPESVDKYVISYRLNGNNTETETISGAYAYFKPQKLGVYSEFGVQVAPPTTQTTMLLSDIVYWESTDDQGVVYKPTYNFNMFNAGYGTAESPYEIVSVEQFININYYSDKHFILKRNIESSKTYLSVLVDEFTGVFNGDGKTISKITISTDKSNAGLFGILTDATIKNLTLANISVTNTSSSANYVGVLAGRIEKSNIDAVTINAGVVASEIKVQRYAYVGGLAGMISDSVINNIGVNITIDNNVNNEIALAIYSAGLTAMSTNSTLTSIRVGLTDRSQVNSTYRLAGIVTMLDGGTLTDSYATLDNASSNYADHIGGVVETNKGTIDSCFATGKVTVRGIANANYQRNGYAGGLVGTNDSNGTIKNCYAQLSIVVTTNISATSGDYRVVVGGLVAVNAGLIDNSWVVIANGYATLTKSAENTECVINAFVGKNTTTYSQEGYTYGIKNCYQYIDGGANSGGISQMDSVASMMTEAFKKTLNTNAGKDIYNTTNSGLPEFLWQSKLV